MKWQTLQCLMCVISMLETHKWTVFKHLSQNVYEEVKEDQTWVWHALSTLIKWGWLWHKAWKFWFSRVLEPRGASFVKWVAKGTNFESLSLLSLKAKRTKTHGKQWNVCPPISTGSAVRICNLLKFSHLYEFHMNQKVTSG